MKPEGPRYRSLILFYPIQPSLALGLVVALLLLCFNAWLSYLSVERLIAHNRSLSDGYEVLMTARVTLTSLQDVESSQREYLITGDPDYLRLRDEALNKLQTDIQQLKTQSQQRRIDVLLPQLEQQIKRQLRIGNRGIELRRAGQLEAARRHVSSRQGREAMEQTRHVFRQLVTYETSLLNNTNREAQASAFQALVTLIVAAAANLILLLLVYRMMARDILRRQQAETELRASEAELRASEARKSAILSTALDCIISIDHDNRILEWNPAAEALFGYSRPEAIGRLLPELVVPAEQRSQQVQDIQRYMNALPDGVLGQRIEVEAMRRDLTTFPAELAVTRIEIEGEELYTIYLRDITQRQQAESELKASEAELKASEVRKSAILEAALDCIIGMDADKRVIEWNPAAESIYGYSREEAVGRHLSDLITPTDLREAQLEGMHHFIGELEQDLLGQRIEASSIRRNGSRFPVELAITRIETESGPIYTLYLRDITQRKLIEQALHEARDAAEAANRTKSLFLANMSHELRTPLNVILGYAELLEEEAEDDTSSGAEKQALISDLYKIRHAGHHLLTLINHVLDLSKIEAGKMDVYSEEFDVAALMKEVSETVRLLMEQNQNTLYVHCQPDLGRMRSDPVKIRQALLNLLSNAAKFTHQGTITLEALRETGDSEDWILFCVTDTGIGIAPEHMGKLFEPFTQADPSTTRQYGGTGLGLALTRHFCYLLHGEVTVSSVPDQGSAFTIRLPAGWEAPKAADPEDVSAAYSS